ncbi:hypothetical protein F4678DRAFT_111704 [Xylaria arbuscula]|nr:hypothetical protein F4678DRAFT_111704 [Xylaria arbuscula]
MNWTTQSIPVLINGLPPKSPVPEGDGITDFNNLPMPPVDRIRTCSPYLHILQGTYRTPTFMVHGNDDD